MTGSNRRILLVDDNEIIRTGLKSLVEQHRLPDTVHVCADGASAASAAMSFKPDLVVLGTQFPDMSGMEIARIIKSESRQSRILMITPKVSVDELIAAFQAGADGYCLKNNSAEVLTSAIDSVMEGALWVDPLLALEVNELIRGGGSDSEKSNRPPVLTERETAVLALLVRGYSNKEMADKLGVSAETIKTHMRNVMEKLSVTDRTQAAIKALRMGLVEY